MADHQVDSRDGTGDRRCQARLGQRTLRRGKPVLCGGDCLIVRIELGSCGPGSLVGGQPGLVGGHAGLRLRDRSCQGRRVNCGKRLSRRNLLADRDRNGGDPT